MKDMKHVKHMKHEKTLWQRYGKLGLFVGLIVLCTFTGMQMMNARKLEKAEQASKVYEKMLGFMKQEDFKSTSEQAGLLIKEYPKTPYASLAALMMSRIALDKKDPTQAITLLKTVLSLNEKGPLQDIARIRLARILLSETRFQEALDVLPVNTETKQNSYAMLYEEIRGDIYFKMNELKKAKEAYGKALKAAPPGIPLTSLQLKYTDLNIKEES